MLPKALNSVDIVLRGALSLKTSSGEARGCKEAESDLVSDVWSRVGRKGIPTTPPAPFPSHPGHHYHYKLQPPPIPLPRPTPLHPNYRHTQQCHPKVTVFLDWKLFLRFDVTELIKPSCKIAYVKWMGQPHHHHDHHSHHPKPPPKPTTTTTSYGLMARSWAVVGLMARSRSDGNTVRTST